MSKTQFHVSDSGKLAQCTATKRGCPKGGKHFSEAAKERIESGVPRTSSERSAWLAMSQALRGDSIQRTRNLVTNIDKTINDGFQKSLSDSKKVLDELDGIRTELKARITPDNDPAVVVKAQDSLQKLENVYTKKVAEEKALHVQIRDSLKERSKKV
jgi:hypothetical protein